ncbi:MAG: 50S ribosomal protein L18 [Candidatus Woesearchaeota archaeon]
MANRQTIKYRRAREGRTSYKQRINLLKGQKPRLIIRKSLNNITVSIAEYSPDGDMIRVNVHSSSLKKMGWTHSTGNIPSAYLTGYIAAKKAVSMGIKEAILDLGLQTKVLRGRMFAALKGALDAGMKIPHDEKALPEKNRILGEHIGKESIGNDIESIKSKA